MNYQLDNRNTTDIPVEILDYKLFTVFPFPICLRDKNDDILLWVWYMVPIILLDPLNSSSLNSHAVMATDETPYSLQILKKKKKKGNSEIQNFILLVSYNFNCCLYFQQF